ncbi:MAG: hypothetical protein KUG82_06465 [Pseudomonadales bacterium]|nr:hypothetical protein [Pseudomonadales bacterium]
MVKKRKVKNVKKRRDEKKRIRRKIARLRTQREENLKLKLNEIMDSELELYNKKIIRHHAAFFNWHRKDIKELHLVYKLFGLLEAQTGRHCLIANSAEDPPDVKAKLSTGNSVGVEVTELVNEKAIKHRIKNDDRYVTELLSWNEENTQDKIREIVQDKTEKCANIVDKYDELSLLIFTDEPKLDYPTLTTYLESFCIDQPTCFSSIFILLSPNSRVKGKRLIEIQIK